MSSNGDETRDQTVINHHRSPLGPQRLSSQFDLESELRRRPRNHYGLGLRGLGEAVVLLLVLLVFLVFPLVNAVQARAAFTCRGQGIRNR